MNDIIERLAPEPVTPDPRWAAETLSRITSTGVPRRRWRRFIAIGAVVGVAIGGGAAAVANHGADERFSRSNPANARAYAELDAARKLPGPLDINGRPSAVDVNALTASPWGRSEFGLTVGQPTNADVVLGNLPDLIPTFILEGRTSKTGYFRSDEIYVYRPDGELRGASGDEHNVYGPDGRTLLGTR